MTFDMKYDVTSDQGTVRFNGIMYSYIDRSGKSVTYLYFHEPGIYMYKQMLNRLKNASL